MSGELRTTDTVAAQTLSQHTLSQHKVGGTGYLTFDGYRCSCGQSGQGESWATLHLVEMGVEAGVAAMAELRDRQAEEDRLAAARVDPLQLAERDLVRYLAGMEGAARELDVESWRDVLAVLVSCAADADKRHLFPSTLGARLWLELEEYEDAKAKPGPQMDTSGKLLRTVPCTQADAGTPHQPHAWYHLPLLRDADTESELVYCPGSWSIARA